MRARARRAATDHVGSELGEWPGDTGDGWSQQQIDLGEECRESIGDRGACQQRTGNVGARPRQPSLDLPGDVRIEDGRILAEGVSIECGEAGVLKRHDGLFRRARRPDGIAMRDAEACGGETRDGENESVGDNVIDRDVEPKAWRERDAQTGDVFGLLSDAG